MLFQPLCGLINTDAQYLTFETKHPLTEHKSRVGAAGRCGEHDPVCMKALLQKFLHGEHVAQRTCLTGSAIRNEIGLLSRSHCLIELFLQDAVTVTAIRDVDDCCAEKLVQQSVCRKAIRH